MKITIGFTQTKFPRSFGNTRLGLIGLETLIRVYCAWTWDKCLVT